LQLTNAEVKNVNVDSSTFNILLTFSNERRALLYCRVEGNVKAYNIAVMDGSCPCCLKPTCASIFAKRHELLQEAQRYTKLPSELVTA
jgi:hypothetical protein